MIDDARLSVQQPPSSHHSTHGLNHKGAEISMAGIRDAHSS